MPVPLRQLNDTLLNVLKEWKSYFSANSASGSTKIATFLTKNMTKMGRSTDTQPDIYDEDPKGFDMRSLTKEVDHPDQVNLSPGIVYHRSMSGEAFTEFERQLFVAGDDDKFKYKLIKFESADSPPALGQELKGMEPVQADNFTQTEEFVYWYELENNFVYKGRISQGYSLDDNDVPAYLNRIVHSGSPEDIPYAIAASARAIKDCFPDKFFESNPNLLQYYNRNDFDKETAKKVSQLKNT